MLPTAGLTGKNSPRHWKSIPRNVDLFDLKGEIADFLEKCGLDSWRFIYYSTSETLADNPISVEINGAAAGFLGRVKENICKQFGFEQEVFVAELKLPLLLTSMLYKCPNQNEAKVTATVSIRCSDLSLKPFYRLLSLPTRSMGSI